MLVPPACTADEIALGRRIGILETPAPAREIENHDTILAVLCAHEEVPGVEIRVSEARAVHARNGFAHGPE